MPIPPPIYRVAGPIEVKFNNLNIGVTQQGVLLRFIDNWIPILDDVHGSIPGDMIYTGSTCQIECIGLDVDSLKSSGVLDTMGEGAFFGGGAADMPGKIGSLARGGSYAKKLELIEYDGTSIWTIDNAIPALADGLALKSTEELRVPLIFTALLDAADNKFFSTIPSYIG